MGTSQLLREIGKLAIMDVLACLDAGVGVIDDKPIRIPASLIDLDILESVLEVRMRQHMRDNGIPA